MSTRTGNKVLIGPSSFAEKDKTPISLLEKAGLTVVPNPFSRKLTKPELLTLLDKDVVGLLAGLEPLDREVLSNSRLRCVSRVGAGMANVDLKAAEELGIAVTSTPDAPTQAVAEMTIGALLSLLREIPLMNEELHEGKWTKKVGYQLEGKTCLVIGYGRIGRRVASLLRAFGARIIVYDPFLKERPEDEKVEVLAEGLNRADIVSIHNSGRDCVLGADEFSMMKPGSIVLNAARGSSMDEQALLKALDQGKIRAVWIDSFSEEPYKGPLAKYANALLTPHVGSYTLECRKRMEVEAVQNLLSRI